MIKLLKAKEKGGFLFWNNYWENWHLCFGFLLKVLNIEKFKYSAKGSIFKYQITMDVLKLEIFYDSSSLALETLKLLIELSPFGLEYKYNQLE